MMLFTLMGCQQISGPKKTEFIEPEPYDWVAYMKPVRAYMYYRTQAVVKNDITHLWKQYPALMVNHDLKQGINVEIDEVESLNSGFQLLDANYDVERYERIKVKELNKNAVIVLVHGSIAYLRDDFDESSGEYLIEITLEQQGEHWTVVKTDEYTQPEYKEWVEENK